MAKNNLLVEVTFKYFSNLSPLYMSDVFTPAGQNTSTTRTSLFNLSQLLQKSNHRQKSLSYVALSMWNKLPAFLQTTENINMYKQKVKKHLCMRVIVWKSRHYAVTSQLLLEELIKNYPESVTKK